jgi:uncharacterized protein
MSSASLRYIDAVDPAVLGWHGIDPRTTVEDGLRISYDVPVTVRDGTVLRADVYLPAEERPYPTIAVLTIYGKNNALTWLVEGEGGVPAGTVSKHATFEGPDPLLFCAAGFAVVNVDMRGTFASDGDAEFMTERSGQDGYDVVEWAAAQNWSNGRVGLAGVSYLAMMQYRTAALRPPHLAAIIPWEATSNFYEDLAYTGGIPEVQFLANWLKTASIGRGKLEDFLGLAREHPTLDSYWLDKIADLTAIDIPAYLVAGFGQQGVHLRGIVTAYEKFSGPKWLELHGGREWPHYYERESVDRQIAFFTRFLTDTDDRTVDDWPPVRYVRRHHADDQEWVEAGSWPPDARRLRLHLDLSAGELADMPPGESQTVAYDSTEPGGGIELVRVFDQRTEITGHPALQLWLEAPDAPDADVFVVLQKRRADGTRVELPFFGGVTLDADPAYGWLRASARALLPDSTPDRPKPDLRTMSRQAVDGLVKLSIEILPMSIVFEPGESLVLRVLGTDIRTYKPEGHLPRHETINRGQHIVYSGGGHESWLSLPVIG